MRRAVPALLFILATLLSPLVASGEGLAINFNHNTVRWTGPKAGHALYYTDRAFQRVGRVRIRQGLIRSIRTDVAGYVAVTDCSKVGWIAYISLNGGPVERYQILDCSQPYHALGHVRAGRGAEVNENSMRRNGCIWKSGETKGRCPAQLLDIRRH